MEIQWIYSRVEYMTQYLRRWEDTLTNHRTQIEVIEGHLQKLRTPFAWMNTDTIRRFYDDKEDRLQYTQQMPAYSASARFNQAEREASQQLDPIAKNIADTLGKHSRGSDFEQGTRSFPGTK